MKSLALSLAFLLLAPCAVAFDSAAWQEKREDLSHEVSRLRTAYKTCASGDQAPAEEVVLPIETFPDGSVKTTVQAKKARYFLQSGLVWANGVVVLRFREDGSTEIRLEAAECVVDRLTKSGWAEGDVKLEQGGTVCRGRGVYFSSPEGFVRVTEAADFATTDLKAAKPGATALFKAPAAGETNACLRIRSAACDIDRDAGVTLFETNVVVTHADTTLCADRVFAFAVASNQLSRIVADGHVAVTNGLRTGACNLAVYRRARGEMVMFGAKDGPKARLAETGERANELEGDRIRFWVDSEQVEVENAALATKHDDNKMKGELLK